MFNESVKINILIPIWGRLDICRNISRADSVYPCDVGSLIKCPQPVSYNTRHIASKFHDAEPSTEN